MQNPYLKLKRLPVMKPTYSWRFARPSVDLERTEIRIDFVSCREEIILQKHVHTVHWIYIVYIHQRFRAFGPPSAI